MLSMFYREVVLWVLIFVSEAWFMSASMERTVEGTHTRFLQKITYKWVWRNPEVTCVILSAVVVL